MKLYFNPTSTFIVRSSMVSSVPKGKGCNFTKLGCSVLRTSPPRNTRRVPVCCGSSRGCSPLRHPKAPTATHNPAGASPNAPSCRHADHPITDRPVRRNSTSCKTALNALSFTLTAR
jgi:hypothetical protein